MRGKRAVLVLGLGLGLGLLLAVQSCTANPGDGKKMRIWNDRGEPIARLDEHGSLKVGVHGAEPYEHYRFTVTPSGAAAPIVGQAVLQTDRLGTIEPSFLVVDAGGGNMPYGSYDVKVSGENLDETIVIDFGSSPDPVVITCDTRGDPANSYVVGEPAYIRAENLPADTAVRVGIMHDRKSYADGDSLDWYPDWTPFVDTRTDASGNLAVTEVSFSNSWYFPLPGTPYDAILDFEPYGVFDADTDLVDGHEVVGLTFQAIDVGSDVDADLACDSSGVYKDTFAPGENVYAFINPPLQYSIPHAWVDKYVVRHRDEWKNGDVLQDVSGGNETDGVQTGCTNEYIVMVYPAPLVPGQFDLIIDVDRDGRYTQGVDIVDGGSAESIGEVGFVVQ